ncbi:hypothetical protein BI049_gp063 [Salmonella phage vB_SnwM_CGG4-1]|uniref:Uncharacterized protein n=1 Tax=Salmonella phage vB_SnwM_CGG4-1 TaxID=1815631 RepID=A0A1B0VV22_9CAUD|nr:hypothetical protein BI049_gp063 [Salmonella phage vB_SnwM_CGG4-1]ANA49417.1 hypothetical protein CGG41_063 [Salmonella phage vB_SnwM_CGG4-1]
MNLQLHYAWVHELQVYMYSYIERFGEEFPALYAFIFFG